MIRSKLRSNVKKSNSVRKSSRMEDVFMRAVYRQDRIREARTARSTRPARITVGVA